MKTFLILIGCCLGGLGYWLLTRIAWGKEEPTRLDGLRGILHEEVGG